MRKPRSKYDLVRACLREGPTTSPEVSATTGLPVKNACARLRDLEKRGQARRIGTIPPASAHGGGRAAVLYAEAS